MNVQYEVQQLKQEIGSLKQSNMEKDTEIKRLKAIIVKMNQNSTDKMTDLYTKSQNDLFESQKKVKELEEQLTASSIHSQQSQQSQFASELSQQNDQLKKELKEKQEELDKYIKWYNDNKHIVEQFNTFNHQSQFNSQFPADQINSIIAQMEQLCTYQLYCVDSALQHEQQ